MKIFGSIILILAVLAGGYFLINKEDKGGNESATEGYSQDDVNVATDQTDDVEEEEAITSENNKYMTATLHTNKGDITIEFSSATPNTVNNFTKLAESGFYDGTKFHRVIKGFMSQGGDPLSKDDANSAAWGTGGPGYKFDDEIMPGNSNVAGTISMANAGPNTNGSQFFINAAANNSLDTKHTVFGKVIKGMDVAEAINSVETDMRDRPLEPVIIEKITLE